MASYYDQVNGLAPKVWYRFNETAGTPTNSGSLTTTASFNNLLLNEESDVDGRSVYFDGSSSVVQLNAWPSFSLFNDKSFTIETWFKSVSPFQGTLFTFSGNNPSGNHLRVDLMPSGDANQFKLELDITGLGEQVADRLTYSTNTYNDNTWHHVVVAVNTTSLKWYIDGQLITTKTLTTGTLDWDNYNQSNLQRLIGSGRSYTSNNLNTTKFRGRIDEFALYGFELSAQQVLDNFNAGASVNFADIPGTASALAVQPTLSVTFNGSVDPMVASPASFPLPNATMYPQGLEDKLSSYALELWYKFDLTNGNVPYNYGTGGEIGNNFQFTPTGGEGLLNNFGPNGTSALKLGTYFGHGQLSTSGTDLFTTEISDENFSLGLWFKIDGTENLNRRLIHTLGTGTNHRIYLFTNTSGYINFQYWTSSGSNGYTGSTDLRNDGLWHFAAIRVDGTNVRYYLDGVEVQNQTVTGSRSTPTIWRFGNAGPDGGDNNTASRYYISNFYVASHSEIDATDIDEIWDAGRSVVEPIQARSTMVQPTVSFYNAFNNKVIAENAKWAFGFNNTDAEPINYGTAGITDFQFSGTPTKSIATKNQYAWKFTNTNQYQQFFLGSTENPSSTGYTLAFYGRMTDPGQGNTRVGCWFGKTTSGSTGNYMFFGVRDDGPFAAYGTDANNATTWNRLDTGDTSLFNDYHLYVITKDIANNTWKFYVDGALESNRDDAGSLITSGPYGYFNDSFGYFGGSASWDNYVDEFAYFPHSLTAQEVFELWQSIEINNADDVSSTFVMPAIAAGFGPTVNADEATASAELVDPASAAETNELAIPMDAFAEFILPNFGGNVVIDANYGHTAATADAELPDPQFQIGDFHSADHMDASALFVHPISTGGGSIAVPTAVALDATFVMPGIVTIKGARVFAEPMRSQAIFPLPPAYLQLTDDNWFNLLLAGHAERVIEPVQAQLSNLPNQSTTDVAQGGFLSFFDDLLADRTPTTTTNTVSSEIPAFYFKRAEAYSYDNNGNLIAPDTTKAVARLNAARASSDPAAILGSGTFDPYERKAARFNNIELPLPGTDIYYSQRPYNIEFSFKSTKQDQVIAYGKWNSFNGYARNIGVIGLADGKIYLAEDAYKVFSPDPVVGLNDYRANIPATAPHPKNFVNRAQYLLGRKNVADGQWHHIIIQQGWTDGRTQIWIDGELDRQIGVTAETGGGYSGFPGSDGTNTIRPYIIGFNSNDNLLYSDFETSAFNFYPARFITQDKILANFAAYSKWKPVKAEPMTATIRMTDKNAAKGNRPRALLLYWWEAQSGRGTHDNGLYGYWDEQTFPLDTKDLKGEPPQQYYGWDIFPIDVIGRNKSEMLKENVWVGNGYRDSISGSPRYLDLMNDIDISMFDAIFFKNYPEQTEELDEYTRTEISDTYFGTLEKTLHENFLESLRKAMDTGLSLYVTNSQLALDLGIVDRVERISDLNEGDFEATDTFVVNKFAPTPQINVGTSGTWTDTWRNNRLRVVNTFEDITNYPTYLWRDWMFFTNDDAINFGGVNKPYISLLDRPNGLQVGDEFIISDAYTYGIEYEAVPFANVKAGTILTAFANTVDRNGVAIENPYRNHATSIAVAPGTILKGRPTVGKIFVNFTERITGTVSQITGAPGSVRPHWKSRDTHLVELIQDKWINQAYADGSITLERKNELLASPDNLDRQLEAAITAGNQAAINNINGLKYWDFNGQNIISNKQLLNDVTGGGAEKDGLGDGVRKAIVNKTSRKGVVSTRSVSTTQQWFTITWGYEFPTIQIKVPSILSNGFSWLADKIVDDGNVNRVEAMKVTTAILPMPVVTADKDRTVYAAAMLSNATIIHAPGYALADVSNTTLPLTANAKFGDFVKNIKPDVFLANATFRQNIRTTGIEEDEVVVYMIHVDPILYLREDIIK